MYCMYNYKQMQVLFADISFLIRLMHTIDAMQFAESGILILGINTIIMHAPYRKQL